MAYDILTDGPPAHFDYYLPDVTTGECLIIMVPSKINGAVNFSETNPPMIGIYKPRLTTERFRFKNVPSLLDINVAEVNKLIDETRPQAPQAHKIFSLTDNVVKMIPAVINAEVNYSDAHIERKMIEANVSSDVVLKNGDIPKYEHDQKFDQLGRAIKKIYDVNGIEIVKTYGYIGEKNLNQAKMFNQPIKDSNGNTVVQAFDAYGDAVLGVDGVEDKITIPILLDRGGKTITEVFDSFGNQIIGLTSLKGLIVLPQRLPIKLDSAGRPIKKSVGFNFEMIGL